MTQEEELHPDDVQQHLREKGVALKLKNGVSAFVRRGSILEVQLADGSTVETDMVILSIGVKPDTTIARDAKLDLAQNGAIRVDQYFRTSDADIRAVGDAIEFTSPLLGSTITVPLAPCRHKADMFIPTGGERRAGASRRPGGPSRQRHFKRKDGPVGRLVLAGNVIGRRKTARRAVSTERAETQARAGQCTRTSGAPGPHPCTVRSRARSSRPCVRSRTAA